MSSNTEPPIKCPFPLPTSINASGLMSPESIKAANPSESESDKESDIFNYKYTYTDVYIITSIVFFVTVVGFIISSKVINVGSVNVNDDTIRTGKLALDEKVYWIDTWAISYCIGVAILTVLSNVMEKGVTKIIVNSSLVFVLVIVTIFIYNMRYK
tara:strand:+ start:207 stop:674 length:468 start_codon:yes stop_codon:yes gene_type:complete